MVDASSSTSSSATSSSSSPVDISSFVLPHLDRHLALPVLQFLEESNVYPKSEMVAAKYDLLKSTNMVHYIEQLRREMEGTAKESEEPSKETQQKADEILKKGNQLREKADKVIEVISNPQVAASLGQDKERNLATLREKYSLDVQQIDSLYQYGQYCYSLGDYAAASDYLNSFRILSVDPTLTLSAFWGKLVSNILEEPLEGEEKTYETARDELKLLRDDIESHRHSRAPHLQLQQRTAWLHWSLFVYFKMSDKKRGMQLLVEAWTESTLEAGEKRRNYYLDTVQSSCPWLLRYLVAAIVISHTGPIKINTNVNPALAASQQRRSILAPKIYQILRIVEQEKYQYSDSVTEFFRLLVGTVDFEGATKCLKECNEQVLAQDYFTSEVRNEFVDRARHFMSEVYCRIHNKIDIADLSSRLGLTADEGERWIVELVRDARLDAKIDLQKNIVTMNKPATSIHQTISDRTKQLLERSQYVLPAPASAGSTAIGGEGGRKHGHHGHGGHGHGRGGGQHGDRKDNQGVGAGQTPRPVEVK